MLNPVFCSIAPHPPVRNVTLKTLIPVKINRSGLYLLEVSVKDVFMSDKESDRFHILSQVSEKKLSVGKASELLNISTRQLIRINNRFKEFGKAGLVSCKRNQLSNRSFTNEFKKMVLDIIEEKYFDIGPTLIAELLIDYHSIKVSHETIRQWLIETKKWAPKHAKANLHPRRERMECYGEMIQSDASDHAWFGENEPRCHLHLLIDDATSSIPNGYFAPEELTSAYFQMSEAYFRSEGFPRSLYVDRRGVFKVNSGNDPHALTQYGRAMKELGIKLIFARSSQAKGRVERSFKTHQDRLVKLLRVEGITNIKDANQYLPEYINKHNGKFSVKPKSSVNVHRAIPSNLNLTHILCEKDIRTVSKDLQISFEGTYYQIIGCKDPRRLQKAKINIIKTLDGQLKFEHQGVFLQYKIWKDMPYNEKS